MTSVQKLVITVDFLATCNQSNSMTCVIFTVVFVTLSALLLLLLLSLPPGGVVTTATDSYCYTAASLVSSRVTCYFCVFTMYEGSFVVSRQGFA